MRLREMRRFTKRLDERSRQIELLFPCPVESRAPIVPSVATGSADGESTVPRRATNGTAPAGATITLWIEGRNRTWRVYEEHRGKWWPAFTFKFFEVGPADYARCRRAGMSHEETEAWFYGV